MKNKLALLYVAMLSALPLLAADNEPKPANIEQRLRETKLLNIEQRLRETDLALALRQYERVRTEAFEIQLQLDLLETEPGMSAEQRKQREVLLKKRSEILHERAASLRETAIRLGEQLAVAKNK